MEIYTHTGGPVDTNSYLVVDAASRQAVAIDAPEGSAPAFLRRAERDNLAVVRLILTHGHWDHIMDALFFKRAFQCPIAIHPADAHASDPLDGVVRAAVFDPAVRSR